MFRNYLKVVWRNLSKNKLYSFINIAGLSVGIACCVLIFLYVQYELSYDKYNVKAGQIYRLTEVLHLPDGNNERAVTSPPMAPKLQANFPEVLKSVRISYSGRYLSYEKKKIPSSHIMYADSAFFDIFTFPMISGSPQKALVNPYSIVLTESMAKKYFGAVSPLGKIMQLSDTIPLTITGVVKDVPINSHFSFDCILSRSTINALSQNQPETEWFNNNYYTYLLLPANCDYHALENKFSSFVRKEMADEIKSSGLYYDLKLQPLLNIHLRSNLNSEINPNGDITYVYIFSAAAFLILLIACINFINLSTAKSVTRAKEIGLRKVIGANRFQLVVQFLGESLLFTVIATVISVVLIQIGLPYFNSFTGRSLTLFRGNAGIVFLFAAIIFLAGFLAGIYPALLMSSFSPVQALKGPAKYEWRDIFLRKGLVVFQFTVAIILIAGAGLVYKQLQFIQNQKIGLNKDQVIEVPIPPSQSLQKDILLQQFQETPNVVNASLTSFSFKEPVSRIATLPEGFADNQVNSYNSIFVDQNFVPTFQIPLAAGRNFSTAFPTDSNEAFIINEAAVKAFRWKNDQAAIGKNIDWGLGKKGKVIGVVKDFNYTSLHDNVKPLIIQILPEGYSFIALRVNATGLPQTIAALSSKWKELIPDESFQYSFLDDDFAALYQSEQNLQRVLGLFTVLSVFIACLGLFGLAAFTIRQRFKEIGIRKVIGASTFSIVSLISKDFLKLVVISFLIAAPVAWFGVNKWLQNFAYQVSISW
ncbi:MAG TPA: ABC transporter permease, partial [Parafilimonas sp.]|nr:ABC transporter permease [Parafilimonas sp.]